MFKFLLIFLAAVSLSPARAQTPPPSPPPSPAASTPLRVVVTIAPLKGLVEPLLPPDSQITVLMPPGRSEHGYEFTPADLAAASQADLIIYIGLGLEPRLEAALRDHPRPARREVCFAVKVGLSLPASDPPAQADPHDHSEPGHVHTHDCDHAIDPHLWLDPQLVEQFIVALASDLSQLLAARSSSSDALNALADQQVSLLTRINTLHESHRARLAPFKGRAIVTHHNAFNRLADRYGLRIAAVIRESEDAEPSPAHIAAVVKAIRAENVPVIFVEPQFDPKVARRIAKAANVKTATLDPLGTGDWFALMEANLKALESNLK